METIVFGNFTVLDIIITAVIVIGFLYFLPMVKRIFKKKHRRHIPRMPFAASVDGSGR